MKRDMDFVRDLLLKIEELDPENSLDLIDSSASKPEKHKLYEHLKMLIEEADLVRGEEEDSIGFDPQWYNLGLTWQGHEYLDNIRDPEIWRKTKEEATKLGGFSLELVGALAKGLLKKQIEKHTGVEIDL